MMIRPLVLLLLILTSATAAGRRIATLIGNGVSGYSGDGGPAGKAQVNNPYGLTIGPDGALYVCEVGSHVIRRMDLRTGILTTVAGNDVGKPEREDLSSLEPRSGWGQNKRPRLSP